jgi:HK97 family phage portal protein
MAFLRSFTRAGANEFLGLTEKKRYATSGYSRPGEPYKDGWDVERGINQALDRVVWVYKAVYAIASNSASLPIGQRKGDWRIGEMTWDDPLLELLNRRPNKTMDAFTFRFMLSSQVLLSKKGAYVEMTRNRLGDVASLFLHQPQYVFPIPDPVNFVAGYSVEYPNTPKKIVEPENMMWIRVPHPIDPYKGQTPLESAGLAVEFDYYSRVYNRNFVINDGRPGGILVVKGDMEEEQSEEIARRFRGTTGSNIGGAGRTTVISAEDASFIDTSINQRDAQYTEARSQNKEEILLAFGVPESVIGNASGRTFANADVELEVFWRETMVPHLTLLERAFDILDTDLTTYFAYDLSSVAILSRDDRERATFHLEELKQGAISIDEYRELTGREGVGIDELLVPTNLSPVVMSTDGGGLQDGDRVNPNQRPGRRPNDQPDEAVPGSGSPSPTSPRVTTDNTENPSPRAIYEPSLAPLSHPMGDGVKDVSVVQRRTRQLDRLEASVTLQVASFFKRQQRVVMEKASSKKTKERWDSGEKIAVDDFFDADVWNRQLETDGKTWISAVFLDGAIDVAGDGFDRLDMQGKQVQELIEDRISNLLLVNSTTRMNMQKMLDSYAGRPHAAFVAELSQWMSDSFSKRIKTIVRTEVSGAFNAGLLWAARQLGYTQKTWIHATNEDGRAEHHHVSNTTVSIDEAFDIQGKAVRFPGDFVGDGTSVINCRCTLSFA